MDSDSRTTEIIDARNELIQPVEMDDESTFVTFEATTLIILPTIKIKSIATGRIYPRMMKRGEVASGFIRQNRGIYFLADWDVSHRVPVW